MVERRARISGLNGAIEAIVCWRWRVVRPIKSHFDYRIKSNDDKKKGQMTITHCRRWWIQVTWVECDAMCDVDPEFVWKGNLRSWRNYPSNQQRKRARVLWTALISLISDKWNSIGQIVRRIRLITIRKSNRMNDMRRADRFPVNCRTLQCCEKVAFGNFFQKEMVQRLLLHLNYCLIYYDYVWPELKNKRSEHIWLIENQIKERKHHRDSECSKCESFSGHCRNENHSLPDVNRRIN